MNIVVGIPALNWNDTRAITSFCELRASECLSGYSVIGATLLPDARNKIVRSLLHNNPDFTHLLFIDDDMCDYDTEHLKLLIQADKPIISALVTTRRKPYTVVISYEDLDRNEVIKRISESQIRESDYVGMAFTVIKREVLDAVVEETEDGPIWFNTDRGPRETFETEVEEYINESIQNEHNKSIRELINEAIAFGMAAHIGSKLCGEDVSFCKRAKMLGFKSYVHWAVIVGHLGTQPITIRDVLLGQLQDEVAENLIGAKTDGSRSRIN